MRYHGDMNGRRSFFRSLLALPSAAVVATVAAAPTVPPSLHAPQKMPEDLKLRTICAAMERIGWMAPGEHPTPSELTTGLFHLESILNEGKWDSPSIMSIELSYRLKADQTRVPIKPVWTGTPLNNIPPAEHWLDSGRSPFFTNVHWALPFYHGQQWDDHCRQSRDETGRITLVANYLPQIVAIALARSIRSFDLGELQELYVAVTVPNADPQRLYNYMVSIAAEEAREKSARFRPAS